MDSMILQSPLALLLYGIALFLNLFDRHYKMTHGVFTLIATAISAGTTAYSILIGATLWEAATVLLIFLLLNMGGKE